MLKLRDACIACDQPRMKGSGFCKPHKVRHDKSPWVKAFRAYQAEAAVKGYKNVIWSPPKERKK